MVGIHGLNKTYKTAEGAITVLQDIDLRIEKGDISDLWQSAHRPCICIPLT